MNIGNVFHLNIGIRAIKRIAILGGSGFIGSNIYRSLLNFNANVIFTSRYSHNNNSKNFIKFDLFDKHTWSHLLEEFKPNIILTTIWETEHEKYWEKQSNFEYMKATLKLAETSLNGTVDKFICFGSMAEYGYSPGKCNSESTPVNPQDIYSESKVLTSIALDKIAKNSGKNAHWIRLFQAYGEKEKRERLIPKVILKMLNGEPISINSPNHKLDFTYIRDITEAIKVVILNNLNYSINIGTGIATSVKDVCLILGGMMNYDLDKITFMASDKERIIYVDPEFDPFKGHWKPNYELNFGLKRTILSTELKII